MYFVFCIDLPTAAYLAFTFIQLSLSRLAGEFKVATLSCQYSLVRQRINITTTLIRVFFFLPVNFLPTKAKKSGIDLIKANLSFWQKREKVLNLRRKLDTLFYFYFYFEGEKKRKLRLLHSAVRERDWLSLEKEKLCWWFIGDLREKEGHLFG